MAGVDTSILSRLQPLQVQQRDPLESYGKALTLKNLAGQGDLQALQLQQAQQGVADDQATRQAFTGAGGDESATLKALLSGGQYKAAQALQTAILARKEKESTIGKNDATAGKTKLEADLLKLSHGAALLSEAKDPQSFATVLRIGAANGTFDQKFVEMATAQGYSPDFVRTLQQAGLTHAQQLAEQDKAATRAQTAATAPFTANPTPGGAPVPNAAVQAFELQKRAAGRPVTNVSVSTEKKYGEQFAGKIASADSDMRDAAIKAPDLAQRANQMKQVLASGKVITGTGADARLAIGKALNLAGASDAETIANTEALSVDMARNTLDAIKQSGLGSGTGFSNADRDFLEKAAGGKISLESATIDRLSTLAHRAAQKSAERWNTRVKDIPQDALQGTGIKTDPVQVPGLYQAPGGTAAPTRAEIEAELRRRQVIR